MSISTSSPERIAEWFELVDQLHFGRETMREPQDLPGRYGRVIKSIDHLLKVTGIESVLGGGWAVWRHGFDGRMTQDVDIALPADRIQEFTLRASVSGFTILPQKPGRWPKLLHKETGVKVDILPEGARPGVASKLAPTTIPHPKMMGAVVGSLHYIDLPSLFELKLAAGREQDDADVVKLVQTNQDQLGAIRAHLATVHAGYVQTFDYLVQRAQEQKEEP